MRFSPHRPLMPRGQRRRHCHPVGHLF